jgi:ATP-dependent protease ClpP protease subunit
MQFFYSEPQNELEKMLGGFFCINAVGKIETGDDAIFAKFLDQHRPPAHMVVYIDSNGGDLEAGSYHQLGC